MHIRNMHRHFLTYCKGKGAFFYVLQSIRVNFYTHPLSASIFTHKKKSATILAADYTNRPCILRVSSVYRPCLMA